MKKYKHEVCDLFEKLFWDVNISAIHMEINHIENNLKKITIEFFPPYLNHLSYSIMVMYRASMLDNIKQWKVFEDDDQTKNLLNLVEEYENMHIDSKEEKEEQREE